ncbi:hypothetical protein Pla100_09520 [Neorhodopirellula pilleata]|uniref:Uncharacterized protein n=1 Tax=Neorhodopirellula pilleata TaxID=2714738 RepID=A0A5C6AYF7_9BACT|nr:hypothetical protein Pla100_09520 [Neorhodopirellula pilleata]
MPVESASLDPDLLQRLSTDPAKRIDEVIAYFRREKRPVELFEALKMKSRLAHGLPMMALPDESLDSQTGGDPELQRSLEEGLLDACRQAGAMLIENGKVGEGYMYLRPVGDNQLVRRLLADVPITDENYDEMVHVLLHEGIDLGRGYQAVIEHQGTCNSITLYDQAIAQRPRVQRQIASRVLLNHFYAELTSLVRNDFAGRANDNGVSADDIIRDERDLSLGDLIAKYKWILGGGGYHLDTTHLASTVRFATVLDDAESIDKAIQLCQYGRKLPADFQYPGEEPFVDFYPAHAAFFAALAGQNVESALRLFEQRARTVDVNVAGSGAIETYIDLLDRIGRPGEALRAAMELFPDDVPVGRVMPEMMVMARRAVAGGDVEIANQLEQFCSQRGDLLGVAAVSELNTAN